MDQSNMSSVRKKLDEYHLKVLRELVTLPANKYCFDCHQIGPTYVNVTIGSFVCTKCSGMLRGLTPPHRVKSISMATFTPEEMEFIKSRGNEYCRRVWLGLHSADQPTKDELQIKDFMISKYEKRRYYVDPAIAPTINGFDNKVNGSSVNNTPPRSSSHAVSGANAVSLPSPPNTLQLKTTKITSAPVTNNSFTSNASNDFFVADFGSPLPPPISDPFSSPINKTVNSTASSEASFANFDNNPIFTPPSQGFPNISTAGQPSSKASEPTPPTEDRYAALKDLDSELRLQNQQMTTGAPETQPPAPISEWGLNGNSSWGTSSVFDTPPNLPESTSSVPSNPFSSQNGSPWSSFNNNSSNNSFSGNPFRVNRAESAWSVTPNGQLPNGFPTSQSLNFASTKAWIKNESPINPFAFSPSPKSAGHHSSNPFL